MSTALGAYGLRVEGLPASARALLNRVPEGWPRLELRATEGVVVGDDTATFAEARARVPMPGGGEIVVERSPLVADVRMPAQPVEAELLHPYLGYVAVVAGRWLGSDCIHGGAFVAGGGAFAVVGRRATGKSSVLAVLARRGHDVVSDDVLVVRDGRVCAGPRFVDLRADAAVRLRGGEALGMVGARERWRVRLAPVAAELPLRGWLLLDWGDRLSIDRLDAGAALVRIKEQLSLFTTPRDPAALLDLVALPAWRVTRPFGWESIEPTVDAIASTASAA